MKNWRERAKLTLVARPTFSAAVFLLLFVISASVLLLNFSSKRKSMAAAATCYWVGDTSPANWNDATHWSSSSGGGGSTCDGGVVPGSDDTVIFDSANTNSANFDSTATVLSLDVQTGYSGTITFANDAALLTTTDLTLSAGNISVAVQGTYRTKIRTTNFIVSGGSYTQDQYHSLDINGAFTMTSGSFVVSGIGSSVYVAGNLDLQAGTFTDNSGGGNTGFYMDGNTASVLSANVNFKTFYNNKTAGQTLTFQDDITTGTFRNISGSLDTNGRTLTLNVMSGLLRPGGQSLDYVVIDANPVYMTDSGSIDGTLTVNSGKILTLQSSCNLTFSDSGRLVLNGNGAIDSYYLSPGATTFIDDSATYIPTGGTLAGKIKILAASKNIILPARNYEGRLDIESSSGSEKTVTLGAGTFNLGNHGWDNNMGSGLFLAANGNGDLILDGSINSPTVNFLTYLATYTTGDVDYIGTGAGSEQIKAGNGTWTVKGDMDLSGGSFVPGGSTFVFNGGSSQPQIVTSNGQSFNNLTVSNVNATGFTFADGSTIAGTFHDTTATSKVTFHSTATYTIANINIAGTAGVGNVVTFQSSTGGSAALFNVIQINPMVSYVSVSDSNASGGNAINAADGTNTDGGGNTFWNFSPTVPAVPTGVTAIAGNASATVSFTPPTNNGGRPITSYTVTASSGGITATGSSGPITITGLTNGVAYTFTVHATNSVGDSPESAPSNSVTPTAPAPQDVCNNNGLQDNGETGIDCGGGNCAACQEQRAQVISPKLAESYYLGGTVPIKWGITLSDNSVAYTNSPSVITRLEISTNDGNSYKFVKNLLPASISPTGSIYQTYHSGEPYDFYKIIGIIGMQGSYFLYDWQLPIDQTLTSDQVIIRLTPKVYDSGSQIVAGSSRNFTITGTNGIRIQISPDETVAAPGGRIQYSAVVYDQENRDITSSCPVSWSMRIPAAGSIDQNGLLTSTLETAVWTDSVKGEVNCAGLTDFQLATFATTLEPRVLTYAWANPWSARVKNPVRSASYNIWGYDQFGLRLHSANYSFSILDPKLGAITSNGRVVDVATSNNWGCYQNKIKGIASYNGIEKPVFQSVAIYPENYAYGNGSFDCAQRFDLKDKILTSIIGASRVYSAEGQIFADVSYNAPQYFRPGQASFFAGVPRDQFYTPMNGVKVEYSLKDTNAGQLGKDGKFIATTNLGKYPKAIEITASSGSTVITRTFDVTVTNEKRRATAISVWGPTGAPELASSRVLKMWKGSGYSFFGRLKDQFGDTITNARHASIENISEDDLVDILGTTTLQAKNKEGVFRNAIKMTYDIEGINREIANENEKIEGTTPVLYLTLDINDKNDNPAACLIGKPEICDPLDPNCVQVCTGDDCNLPCIGSFCIRNRWINDIITAVSGALKNKELMNNLSVAAAIIVVAIPFLLALLSLLANLLPFIKSSKLFSYFMKGKDKDHARGLVYEIDTGLAVPGVTVMLLRVRDSKLESTSVTGNDGKFALPVPPNEYFFVKVKSDNYELFDNRTSGIINNYGAKYANNYYGEKFYGKDTSYYFDRSIPMKISPTAVSSAIAIRRVEMIGKILRILNIPLLFFGFALSLYGVFQSKTWLNFSSVLLYFALFLYYFVNFVFLKGRSYGLVYRKIDQGPVELAVVRAISELSGKLVRTTVSDHKGRFAMALPKDRYNIVATKSGLVQNKGIKSEVKSNFSPTKEKLFLDKEVLPGAILDTTEFDKDNDGSGPKVFEDANEIIERFSEIKK